MQATGPTPLQIRIIVMTLTVVGVLIIAGFVFVAVEVASRVTDSAREAGEVGEADGAAPVSAQVPAALSAPAALQTLTLPDGLMLGMARVSGNRLILPVRHEGDPEDTGILILDLQSGRPLAIIGGTKTAALLSETLALAGEGTEEGTDQ